VRGLEGTVVDVVVVLVAAVLGLLLRKTLNKEHEKAVLTALGLAAIPIGVYLFLETENPLVGLISIPAGFLWGCLWRLEERLESLGDWLKKHSRFLERLIPHREEDDFTAAFVYATVVSLIGPLAVMGPIRAGTLGDCEMLYTKCIFDGFATVIFAAAMGEGVLFSAIPILLFQGLLTVAASWVSPIFTETIVAEMTAVGGVMIMAMGIKVSGMMQLKMANFLPALLLAPIVVTLLSQLPL